MVCAACSGVRGVACTSRWHQQKLDRRVRGGEQVAVPVRLGSEAGGDDDGATGRVAGDDFDDDLPGLPATPAGVVDEHEPCAQEPAEA